MIPKPPFACNLSLEEELVAFERLKPRLAEIWSALTASDDRSYTSVVVPSMTLDQSELRKLVGAPFYEERLLMLLIRLRNPKAHVVYVTSQPVHPLILEYYLTLLMGVPASHARKRLTMLCAYDSSPRPLTQKILERPRLVERIRSAIVDPTQAYMTVFNSTPLERKLSVLLGVPLNGLDPKLHYLGTKSGSRKVFREAGVELPAGFEDLNSEADIVEALLALQRRKPGLRRAVIKLNESFSGEGNAVCTLPAEPSREAMQERCSHWSLRFRARRTRAISRSSAPWAASSRSSSKASRRLRRAPSCAPAPMAAFTLISTHDQILGGSSARSMSAAASRRRTPIAPSSRGWRCGSVVSSPITASSAVSASISWRPVRAAVRPGE